MQDSCEVDENFHPRFSKSRKTYEYRILNRRFRMPTRRLDTYFYHHALDVEKMQEAAQYLVGNMISKVSVRQMRSRRPVYAPFMHVPLPGRMILLPFAYRETVFVQYGPHHCGDFDQSRMREWKPEDMKAILAACDRSAAGPTAPAHGLTMIGLDYE